MSRHVKRSRSAFFGPLVAIISALLLIAGLTSAVGSGWPFPPPGSPKQVEKTGTSVTVRWNSVPTANLYYVRYATNPGMTENKKVVSSTTTQKNITGLKPNTWYYIQVRAARGTPANHTLLTEYGKYDNFRTYAYSFDPPSNFKVDYELNDAVGLSWKFVNNADSYRIQITDKDRGTSRTIRVKDTDTLIWISHEVTGLSPGTRYEFRIRGLEQTVDAHDQYHDLTDWSGARPATTSSDSPTTKVSERPPGDPYLTNISTSTIALAWEPGDGTAATGYRIEVVNGSTQEWVSRPNSGPAVTFSGSIHTDSGKIIQIRDGQTYGFRVAALKPVTAGAPDGVRISGYTPRLSVSPTFPEEPPANLRVDQVSGDSVRLRWDPVAGATQYRVDWTRDATPSGKCEETDNSCRAITPSNASSPEYVLSGLRPGTTYYFRVSSVNAAGKTISDYQPIMATATTIADAPTMLKQIPNDPSNTRAVTLKWSASTVPGVTSYQVKWSHRQEMDPYSTATVTGGLTHRITNYRGGALETENLYYVQVRGRYTDGSYTGWSNVLGVYTRPNSASISGTVNDAPGTDSSSQTIVYAYDNSGEVGGLARPAADGTFTIWDLPPGSWKLHYAHFGTDDVTSPWYRSSGSLPFYRSQATAISTSTTDQTVPAVTPVAGISIKGSVTGALCRAGTRVTALSDNTAVSGAKDTVLGDTRTASDGAYIIHGLPKNEGYWLRFASTNCGTNSVFVAPSRTGSNVTGVDTSFESTTPDPDPGPGPGTSTVVENVKVTKINDATHDDATISWKAFPNAQQYRVYWSTVPSMPSACEPTCQVYSLAQLDETSPPSISLKKVIGNVRAGGTYYVMVSALDANGKLISKGGWSNRASINLPGTEEPRPGIVGGIHLKSMTSSGATIGWDAVPTATKYRIYYKSSASMPSRCEPNCEVIVPSDRANPTFLIKASKIDRRFIKISAITTENGKDKTITGWQNNPFSYDRADVVQELDATAITSDDATISWKAFPNAQQYRVYWSTVPSMPSACEPTCQVYSLAQLDETSPPSISLKKVIGNVQAGAIYYVKVSALDADGGLISVGGWQSSPLKVDLGGVSASLPGVVSGLTSAATSSGVRVRWTALPTATKYRIYYTPTSSMPSRCEPYCKVIVPTDRANPSFLIPNADLSRKYVKISAITTQNGKDQTITGWQSAPYILP